MHKHFILSILAGLFLLFATISCSQFSGSYNMALPGNTFSTAPSASKYTIGVSLLTTQLEYYISYIEGIKNAARLKGLNAIVVDSKWDSAKQQSDIKNFIDEKVDAIICSPTNPDEIKPVLLEAKTSGIPVVVEMTYISDIYPLVGTDQYEGGKLAGDYAGQWIKSRYGGKCDVAILDFPYLKNTVDRSEGFKHALNASCPGAKIVVIQDGQAKEETANKVMNDIMAKYPNVRCVFGINDDTAKGANLAFHGMQFSTDDICIIGFDADKTCRKLIASNEYIKASVAADTDLISTACIDTAISLIKGQSISNWVEVKGAQYLVSKENIKDHLSDIN